MSRISGPMVPEVVSTLAFMPSALWAQGPTDADRWGFGPHMGWWSGGWWGMIFGPLFMILMLVGVVAVVLLLARRLGGTSPGVAEHQGPPRHTALDILKERYARGEINKDEFEERRRVLGD